MGISTDTHYTSLGQDVARGAPVDRQSFKQESMKCFVIPVIIGATGIVSKSLQKYLETKPGQHSIDSLQKLPY
jgi:hypothetical protein